MTFHWSTNVLISTVFLIYAVSLSPSGTSTKEIFFDKFLVPDADNCTSPSNGSVLDDCTLCRCTRKSVSTYTYAEECVISEDDVIHLMSLLQEAWRLITGTFSSRFTSYSDTNTTCTSLVAIATRPSLQPLRPFVSACDEMLSSMESLILDITEQIKLLIAWLDDPVDLNPRLKQLEECVRCLDRQMDDLEKTYEQEIGNLTEQFGEMQQCFTNAINERKKEIEGLQVKLQAKSFQLIKFSINAYSYPDAISEFIRQNNDSMLEPLVEETFTAKTIENLLRFTFLLPNPEQRIIAYKNILTLLSRDSLHFTMHTLSFHKVFTDDKIRICDPLPVEYCETLPAGFRDLQFLVDKYLEGVVKSLSKIICDDPRGHHSILLVGSPEAEITLAGSSFSAALVQIVQQSYNDCPQNVTNILSFVYNLRWNSQKVIGFSSLLGFMTNNADKLKLAFELKIAAENLRGPDGNVEDAEDGLMEVRAKLPTNVRNVGWHSTCSLQNVAYNQDWLYVGGTHTVGISKVLMRDKNDTKEVMWTLEPIQQPNGDYNFLVKNDETGEYMSSHIPWRDAQSRWGWVAACNPYDDDGYAIKHFHWQVDFGDQEDRIKLFHVGRKAYLSSANIYDNDHRHALLDLQASREEESTDWLIVCNNF